MEENPYRASVYADPCIPETSRSACYRSTPEHVQSFIGRFIYIYTDKGELIRAQITVQGYKEISRVALLEPTFPFAGRNVAWSPPAYANRHIFVRSGKELICASLAVKP